MIGLWKLMRSWFKSPGEEALPVPATVPQPTVRHLPDDGQIPPELEKMGWIRVKGMFIHERRFEDAMVDPGKPVCIDYIRPGECVDMSLTVREPFQRAKTPGEQA